MGHTKYYKQSTLTLANIVDTFSKNTSSIIVFRFLIRIIHMCCIYDEIKFYI